MPSTATDRLQGVLTSTAVKAPCKAVATTDIALNGERVIGGVACFSGDRVLKAIPGGSVDSGIWVVDTGDWSRARDFDGSRDVVKGTIVLVAPGPSARFWQLMTEAPVIGQSVLTFEQIDYSTTGAAPDSTIVVQQPFAGSVARTQHDKNQEWISVKDFGALGDDAADDSAEIALADAVAVLLGVPLLFPAGTYRCKAITLHNIIVNGVIKSTGSTSAEAVILAGSIDANEDRQIFAWTATDPTNLPGTTYPFLFQSASTGAFGARVSVKWFGAKGDMVTAEARYLNACATAMSKSQVGGTPYATKRGPVVMSFPRGNYRIGKDETVNITLGTVLEGQASGSNPLSTLIKDDVTYGSGSADMIWWVGDNVTHTDSPAQMVCKSLSFIWRPSIDFASSTAQLDTAFMNFKALCIDGKFHDCWFLGAPQKGAIFAWGNKYTAAGGGGLQKTNAGADSDGLLVTLHAYNTFFDVCYGTLVTVLDKGYGATYFNNCFGYQIWLGFSRNYSTHSTERLSHVFNTCKLYGVCAAADATIYNLDNHAATVTTGRTRYRNTDIILNNPQVTNAMMTGISFSWQCWLQNSTLEWSGGLMDSNDSTVRFFYPLFGLDQYANSLRIKGVTFQGAMTPGGGVPANFQSLISRINTGTLTGATTSLIVTGNNIDLGTMAYFVYKDGANATITATEVTGNVCSFVSGRVSFDVTGATRYHFTGNYYSNTANVLTP